MDLDPDGVEAYDLDGFLNGNGMEDGTVAQGCTTRRPGGNNSSQVTMLFIGKKVEMLLGRQQMAFSFARIQRMKTHGRTKLRIKIWVFFTVFLEITFKFKNSAAAQG